MIIKFSKITQKLKKTVGNPVTRGVFGVDLAAREDRDTFAVRWAQTGPLRRRDPYIIFKGATYAKSDPSPIFPRLYLYMAFFMSHLCIICESFLWRESRLNQVPFAGLFFYFFTYITLFEKIYYNKSFDIQCRL